MKGLEEVISAGFKSDAQGESLNCSFVARQREKLRPQRRLRDGAVT